MHFDAFESENYPELAKAGVAIDYNHSAIRSHSPAGLKLLSNLDVSISILKLFPGISRQTVGALLNTPGLKGLILETFGSGNAPSSPWFIALLKETISKGVIVLNISQCPGGMVTQGKYETSKMLQEIGVIGGADMTTESAVTKLMVLLGTHGTDKTKELISKAWVGELTE